MKKKVVSVDPEVMGGTPCFTGTRVPVQTFLDYVEGGDSIDEFLADFPKVKRSHLVAFLQNATEYFVAVVTNGDDADLELSSGELARLNSWADNEKTAGRRRVFESLSDYVRVKIAHAKQAVDEGRVVSHEEVKRRFVRSART